MIALQTIGTALGPLLGLPSPIGLSTLDSKESKLDRGETSAIRAPSITHCGGAAASALSKVVHQLMFDLSDVKKLSVFTVSLTAVRVPRKVALDKSRLPCCIVLQVLLRSRLF